MIHLKENIYFTSLTEIIAVKIDVEILYDNIDCKRHAQRSGICS